jgi:hypothetical protein
MPRKCYLDYQDAVKRDIAEGKLPALLTVTIDGVPTKSAEDDVKLTEKDCQRFVKKGLHEGQGMDLAYMPQPTTFREVRKVIAFMRKVIAHRQAEDPKYRAPISPFWHKCHPKWGPFTAADVGFYEECTRRHEEALREKREARALEAAEEEEAAKVALEEGEELDVTLPLTGSFDILTNSSFKLRSAVPEDRRIEREPPEDELNDKSFHTYVRITPTPR